MYIPIRIVIADDHEIYRNGFKLLLKNQDELELVGEAENGLELIEVVTELRPDVVITDIKMPQMDGIEACKILKQKFPEIKLIALSMFNEDNLIIDMLEAGARGYLLKNTKKSELLLAAKEVFEGRTYYCSETSGRLTKMIAESRYIPYRQHPDKFFSKKEKEIMRLICQQYTNKEIAIIMKLSARTIEDYREKIQEKTESRNSIGIAIYAIRHNIYKL
jgi:DNA-binding NarL/FixJ family response regulator